MTLAAAATALLAGQAGSAAGPWLFLAAAVLGGFSLTIHSLCIAYTHDYLDPAEMVAASSGLVLVLGAGSILGPLAVGPVIGTLGPSGFFWWLALVHLGLAAFALWRMTRRAPQPSEEQGSFMPAPTQTGSLAPALAPEEAGAPSTAGEAEPRPREADAPADPPEGGVTRARRQRFCVRSRRCFWRFQSRFLMSSRLSAFFLPRARPRLSFAMPRSLK